MRIVPAILTSLAIALVAAPSPSHGAPTDQAVIAMRKGEYRKAFNELRPLAAKHNVNAEFLLGMLYDSGKGVAQDQAAAAMWYRRAAEQRHLMAQLYLGMLLYSGQGVKQDRAEAARWFRAPAEEGDEEAQFYLGAMYESGSGLPQDTTEAIRWLSKSAAQRNPRAMGLLATTLFARSRDERDLVDAYAWSHLAAELDPVQAGTAARGVIAQYCSDQQKQRGKSVMADWKRRWANDAQIRTWAR